MRISSKTVQTIFALSPTGATFSFFNLSKSLDNLWISLGYDQWWHIKLLEGRLPSRLQEIQNIWKLQKATEIAKSFK